MDTKKFELTPDELDKVIKEHWADNTITSNFESSHRKVCNAQVAKVLSLLEPVELEVLRLQYARQIADWDGVVETTDAQWDNYLNQADELIEFIPKYQLYRLKEEQDDQR